MKRKNLFPVLVSGINQIQDEINGQRIDISLDKSTYVMTISLIDKNGNTLNEKTVDFPMGTAFVNADYNKTTKTMIFILESGETVEVPIGDLVEGLVSQTDFDVLSGEVETLKTEVNNNTNAISEINDNLDNLSYGETAGGKNLFKIDTTNWTLTDNGIKNNAKNDGYFLGKIKLFAGKTYKISFLPKSKPTVDSSFTAYIDGSVYSPCTFAHFNSYALNVKVEHDYTATSDCELLYKLWGNSNSDIFEFQLQVEEGTVATDYKPYIPSVKMLADDVSNINSSMSDYGLNNVFDGELEQGGIDSGTKVVKDNYVVTKNKVICSPNDFIKTFGYNLESSHACFYKSDGTYIGGLNALDGCTAPSQSAYCYVEFKRSGITPSTAGHIGVYINNQIDVNNTIQSYTYTKNGLTLNIRKIGKIVTFSLSGQSSSTTSAETNLFDLLPTELRPVMDVDFALMDGGSSNYHSRGMLTTNGSFKSKAQVDGYVYLRGSGTYFTN